MPPTLLSAISGESLVQAVIWLIVAGLIYFVVTWGLSQFTIPDPFKTVIRAILIILVCLLVINVLLGLAGHPLIRW